MDDGFVSLATLVTAAAAANTTAAAPPPSDDGLAGRSGAAAPETGGDDCAFARLSKDLALMRVAALEAFESGTERLLRALADDVLARELALAPADVAALAAHALAAYAEHEPVEIVVAPCDAERVRAPVAVRADPTLGPGDLVVRVRDGAFESTFAFRNAGALARALERYDA